MDEHRIAASGDRLDAHGADGHRTFGNRQAYVAPQVAGFRNVGIVVVNDDGLDPRREEFLLFDVLPETGETVAVIDFAVIPLSAEIGHGLFENFQHFGFRQPDSGVGMHAFCHGRKVFSGSILFWRDAEKPSESLGQRRRGVVPHAVGDLCDRKIGVKQQACRRLDARAGDELPRRLAQKGRNDAVEMAGRKRRHLGQRTQVERFVQMGPDVFDDGVDPPLIIGCRGWFVLHLGDKGILRRGNGLFRFCEFALHHPPESPPA